MGIPSTRAMIVTGSGTADGVHPLDAPARDRVVERRFDEVARHLFELDDPLVQERSVHQFPLRRMVRGIGGREDVDRSDRVRVGLEHGRRRSLPRVDHRRDVAREDVGLCGRFDQVGVAADHPEVGLGDAVDRLAVAQRAVQLIGIFERFGCERVDHARQVTACSCKWASRRPRR